MENLKAMVKKSDAYFVCTKETDEYGDVTGRIHIVLPDTSREIGRIEDWRDQLTITSFAEKMYYTDPGRFINDCPEPGYVAPDRTGYLALFVFEYGVITIHKDGGDGIILRHHGLWRTRAYGEDIVEEFHDDILKYEYREGEIMIHTIFYDGTSVEKGVYPID